MIDFFDIIAFIVFAVLLPAIVVVVVSLGSLPGQIAQKRGHPHAPTINLASWVGIATLTLGAVAGGAEGSSFSLMGILWPLALVWASWQPAAAGPPSELQPGRGEHQAGKEVVS
jgi:hypothetical protein